VIDAVAPIPVVAAGGVGDGRALAAVIAMGGVGVWVGTRFIATIEAAAHPNYKTRLLESTEEDTIVTRSYSGKPMRNVKNRWIEDWESRPQDIQPFPKQLAIAGAKIDAGIRDGDTETGCLPAGQITGLITEIKPARAIVEEMVQQAAEIFSERLPTEVLVRR
ncbi:MAG TPA: nitronate monooxygenase, partial [Dehalococcoidia bacterium]|nr:nitronate monooxygenase [Dehalococcoidia bacterium]